MQPNFICTHVASKTFLKKYHKNKREKPKKYLNVITQVIKNKRPNFF